MTLTRVKGAAVGADIKRQYATVATMTAGRGLRVGDIVQCAERANATFNVVDATTVTENTYNIIAGVADATISFVLRNIGGITSDLQWGVISAAAYSFSDAQHNRACYETMLRNTDYNDFTFSAKANPSFIWGSVNVGRSNITIRHLAGCDIRGRYSDPAEPANGQAGHMFGFVKYTDPYPGTDYSVAGTVSNINYILDGTASTIYDAGHTALHNNNVIAFYDTEDCSVTGTGGVTASDHNGIAFDGDCINPLIDIAYIKNYDDRAITMKGTSGTDDSAKIRVGTLKGATQAGTVGESILVQDFTYAKVEIGDAFLNLSPLGTCVKGLDTKKLVIECGYVKNAEFFCAIEDVGEVHISNVRYDNVTYFVRRGGTSPAPTPLKLVALDNVVCESTVNAKLYFSQVTVGTFNELRVVDCDFEGSTRSFTLYSGLVGTSAPDVYNIKNNRAPRTVTGTHDGSGNAAVLTDTSASWIVNEHYGKTLLNVTDGSSTTVTGNTATTITGVLSGGTDNDWDVSDAYTVVGGWVYNANIWNEQANRPNTVVGGSSFTYDIVGTHSDSPYTKVTVICTHSSSSHRYPVVMDLKDLFLTGADYRQSTTADNGNIIEITSVRTSTSIVFTVTFSAGTGTISSYSLHN